MEKEEEIAKLDPIMYKFVLKEEIEGKKEQRKLELAAIESKMADIKYKMSLNI